MKERREAGTRQDTDPFVIGEIRDADSAKAADGMAEQGKLLFSPLHTASVMSSMKAKRAAGFTLVEMVLVISLLAMLAVMTVPRRVAEADMALVEATSTGMEMLAQAAIAHYADEGEVDHWRRWPGPAPGGTTFEDNWTELRPYLPPWVLPAGTTTIINPWGNEFEFNWDDTNCNLPNPHPLATLDLCRNTVIFTIRVDMDDQSRASALAARWAGFAEVNGNEVSIGVVAPGQESSLWAVLPRDGSREMEGNLRMDEHTINLDHLTDPIGNTNSGLSFENFWLANPADANEYVHLQSDAAGVAMDVRTSGSFSMEIPPGGNEVRVGDFGGGSRVRLADNLVRVQDNNGVVIRNDEMRLGTGTGNSTASTGSNVHLDGSPATGLRIGGAGAAWLNNTHLQIGGASGGELRSDRIQIGGGTGSRMEEDLLVIDNSATVINSGAITTQNVDSIGFVYR